MNSIVLKLQLLVFTVMRICHVHFSEKKRVRTGLKEGEISRTRMRQLRLQVCGKSKMKSWDCCCVNTRKREDLTDEGNERVKKNLKKESTVALNRGVYLFVKSFSSFLKKWELHRDDTRVSRRCHIYKNTDRNVLQCVKH